LSLSSFVFTALLLVLSGSVTFLGDGLLIYFNDVVKDDPKRPNEYGHKEDNDCVGE
jgi:hypothetical protein